MISVGFRKWPKVTQTTGYLRGAPTVRAGWRQMSHVPGGYKYGCKQPSGRGKLVGIAIVVWGSSLDTSFWYYLKLRLSEKLNHHATKGLLWTWRGLYLIININRLFIYLGEHENTCTWMNGELYLFFFLSYWRGWHRTWLHFKISKGIVTVILYISFTLSHWFKPRNCLFSTRLGDQRMATMIADNLCWEWIVWALKSLFSTFAPRDLISPI